MVIEQQQSDSKGSFFIQQDGKKLAEIVYNSPLPGTIIIEHTEVSDALQGQQVGYKLVQAVVDYARANALKIIPLCPFASAVFKKKPEYEDVLYKM